MKSWYRSLINQYNYRLPVLMSSWTHTGGPCQIVARAGVSQNFERYDRLRTGAANQAAVAIQPDPKRTASMKIQK